MERKRVNDDTWICDKLEELIEQYKYSAKRLREESIELCGDELSTGRADTFEIVVKELKGLLYEEQ